MAEDSTIKENPKEIRFVYQKARHHRTMHANGAWSALTPQAEIQVAFYNDLRAMPMSVTHEVEQGPTLGPGTEEFESMGFLREVDVTVVMNVAIAKATVDILNQMIAQAEAIIAKRVTKEEDEGAPKDATRVDIHG
jgi:hypothetical protein